MITKFPAGDVPAYLDWSYPVQTTLITVKDGQVTGEDKLTQIEMWLNPQTGAIEPFVAVYLDKNGRMPIVHTKLLTFGEEAVNPIKKDYPDWGGQAFDGVDCGTKLETAVWVGAAAVIAGLLWLIPVILRAR